MKSVGPFLFVLLSLLNCHSIKVTRKDQIRGIVIERMEPDIYWDRSKNEMIISNFAAIHLTRQFVQGLFFHWLSRSSAMRLYQFPGKTVSART